MGNGSAASYDEGVPTDGIAGLQLRRSMQMRRSETLSRTSTSGRRSSAGARLLGDEEERGQVLHDVGGDSDSEVEMGQVHVSNSDRRR